MSVSIPSPSLTSFPYPCDQIAYQSTHPSGEHILLLIEVADTTANYDRAVKLPLHARAGIREVWLVDLPNGRIELYRDPAGAAYRETNTTAAGGTITPEAFPTFAIQVADILG